MLLLRALGNNLSGVKPVEQWNRWTISASWMSFLYFFFNRWAPGVLFSPQTSISWQSSHAWTLSLINPNNFGPTEGKESEVNAEFCLYRYDVQQMQVNPGPS